MLQFNGVSLRRGSRLTRSQSQHKEAARLEREIARLEATLAARRGAGGGRRASAGPALYSHPPSPALAELIAERARLVAAQQDADARWLAQAVALEALPAASATSE